MVQVCEIKSVHLNSLSCQYDFECFSLRILDRQILISITVWWLFYLCLLIGSVLLC